jgi:sugar phosphate isomerase/epimerase
MVTRREFSRLALAAALLQALAPRPGRAQQVRGVRLGVQTYSFREIPRPPAGDASDVLIEAMKACGFTECELWSPQIEIAGAAGRAATPEQRESAREALRRWRIETPASHFAGLRKKFQSAGVSIYAYNLSFNDSFTDEEIDKGFEQARALGAEVITASTTLSVARRLVPFAATHTMPVSMHNHSNTKDPNEFATPESFTTALAMSPYFRVNLDIGHFMAADFDALAFLREHHDRITNLHLKDRKKSQGANTPWGEGDTPIREVLRYLRDRKSPIRAYVEYEYRGARTPVEEVKACLAFAREALEG